MPIKNFDHINKDIPIYIQIYHDIREKILNHQYLSGEKLPSESQLQKQYGVSRQTIQNTFHRLVNEGLVIRKQGKASYVAPVYNAFSTNETIVLQLGGINKSQVLLTQFHETFARKVLAMSAGTVKIEIHHSSSFGTGEAQIKKVSLGAQDMFGAAVEWLELLDSAWKINSFPFLFNDLQHLKNFVLSPLNTQLKNRLKLNHNVFVLADNWYRPSRVLMAKEPCFQLKDIFQKAMAVPRIPFYKKIWEILEANPVELDFGTEKQNFLNNSIQLMDGPLDSLIDMEIHKVAPYITLLNHLFSRACIVINAQKFNALRSDVQKILISAAEETGNLYSSKTFKQYNQDKARAMAEGAYFIETDIQPFYGKIKTYINSHRSNEDLPAYFFSTIRNLCHK